MKEFTGLEYKSFQIEKFGYDFFIRRWGIDFGHVDNLLDAFRTIDYLAVSENIQSADEEDENW